MHPCCQPRRSGNKAFSQFFLEKIALSAQDRPPRRRVPRKAAAGPALVRSFNHNGMTDAGNGLSLLEGSRAHQCAGARKDYLVQRALLHVAQDMPAHDRRRTATAGTACMGVLFAAVQQRAAVGIYRRNINSVFTEQCDEQVRADRRQIPGQNAVVIGWLRVRVLK